MKNYFTLIQLNDPVKKIPVLKSDGTPTGAEVNPPDLGVMAAYGKAAYKKMKNGLITYANISDGIKKTYPEYYKDNPDNFWTKLFYNFATFVRDSNKS